MVIPTDFTGYSISNAFITVIFINLILPPATDVLRMWSCLKFLDTTQTGYNEQLTWLGTVPLS